MGATDQACLLQGLASEATDFHRFMTAEVQAFCFPCRRCCRRTQVIACVIAALAAWWAVLSWTTADSPSNESSEGSRIIPLRADPFKNNIAVIGPRDDDRNMSTTIRAASRVERPWKIVAIGDSITAGSHKVPYFQKTWSCALLLSFQGILFFSLKTNRPKRRVQVRSRAVGRCTSVEVQMYEWICTQ